MKRRRSFVVSVFALALSLSFAATAISAVARPLKLKGAAQVNGDPFAGAAPFTTTGTGTHLGNFTATGFVTFTPREDGRFDGAGTQTFVAANGDEFYTTFSGILDPVTGKATVNFIINGGTGRFEDASGQFVADVNTVSFAPPTFTFTANGKISY